MISQLRKLLDPINRRIQLMIGRAVIQTISDDNPLQLMQLLLNFEEVRSGMARLQEYGFTSHPLPGAEAVVLFPGGSRDHGIVIAVEDRRYRLKPLAEGEVAIYTDEGDKIHFKRNRIIELTTETFNVIAGTKMNITTPLLEVVASTKVDITSPLVEISGNLTVGGDSESGGDVSDANGSMQEMRDTYNGHTHNDPQGGTIPAPNEPMN